MDFLVPKSGAILELCAVCVSDRSGAQIAFLIIVLAFIVLGLANWAFKKYFLKNKRSQ